MLIFLLCFYSALLKYYENKDSTDVNVDVHLDDIDEIALITDDEGNLEDEDFTTSGVVLSSYDISAPEASGDDVRYAASDTVGTGGRE